MYVADGSNHRVQVFRSNGMFVPVRGSQGYAGDGQFSDPAGIACGPASGSVYVAEWSNHRVQVL